MKRIVAVSALAAVLSSGLVSVPAHAVPTVSWSTPTLDWQWMAIPKPLPRTCTRDPRPGSPTSGAAQVIPPRTA
jgi:hypothetical protein